MHGPWRIRCFGGLKGTLGELEVSRFRTRRAALLFGYLTVFKDRTHPREELGAMLWPDADEATMRARLRLALTSLRRQFEPPILPKNCVIEPVGDAVRLNPEMVSSDVEEFEQLLDASQGQDEAARRETLQRAISLYSGELLPGHYEDWVVAERGRLAERYESALSHLAELCAEAGPWELAQTYARKLIALDPYREDAHCRLMRLQLDAANPRAAMRQFEALKEALGEIGEFPGQAALRLLAEAKELPFKVAKSTLPGSAASGAHPPEVRSKPGSVGLPVRLTRFFGREAEKEYVVRWLEDGPGQLVTLTGFGGSGKTRLSIEIGHEMQGRGWDVWFVPLADVGSASRILDAALTTLRIVKGDDAVQELAAFFRTFERPLLILDNLEHLMEDAAEIVGDLLAATPNLRCIATSRQRLSLEGECELTVSPLPVPASRDGSPEEMSRMAGIRLYVDRCQAIRPDFQISASNAGQVGELCARLEGMPLAIEIAAAMSRTLSPGQLLARMDRRLDLLVSPRRDISPRQKTLRNTIGYSYELLSPEMARFFVSLAVFRGGWTADAAQETCLPQGGSALELLGQLLERSLIERYETPSGEVRFRMLESFREFARERASDDEWQEFEAARDAYFLKLTERGFADLGTPREQTSLGRLMAEHDNLVSVFERALERRDAEFGLRLAVGFGQVWRARGAVNHERAVLEALLALPEAQSVEPRLFMRGLNLLSHASYLLCDWERSMAAEQRTLELANRHGDEEYMAVAYGGMSLALLGLRRRAEALPVLERALDHARRSGADRRISLLLGNVGYVYWLTGDLALAEERFREAREFARKNGSDSQVNFHNLNLARLMLDRGYLDEAIELLTPSLDKAMKLHRSHDVITGLALMARYYRLAGSLARAWALTQIAFPRLFTLSNENSEVYVGIEAGLELLGLGRFGEAVPVLACLTKHDLSAGDRKDVEEALDQCRTALGGEFDRAWARGISARVGELLRALAE